MNWLLVGLGGGIGALARYGLGLWIGTRWEHGFPLGTFLINITGSFLLGLLNILVIERTALSPEWRLAIGVGFLGAYTTFSAFTSETMLLLEENSYGLALGYVSASLLVGILAACLGMYIARVL